MPWGCARGDDVAWLSLPFSRGTARRARMILLGSCGCPGCPSSPCRACEVFLACVSLLACGFPVRPRARVIHFLKTHYEGVKH